MPTSCFFFPRAGAEIFDGLTCSEAPHPHRLGRRLPRGHTPGAVAQPGVPPPVRGFPAGGPAPDGLALRLLAAAAQLRG